jgi:hypothetical protein
MADVAKCRKALFSAPFTEPKSWNQSKYAAASSQRDSPVSRHRETLPDSGLPSSATGGSLLLTLLGCLADALVAELELPPRTRHVQLRRILIGMSTRCRKQTTSRSLSTTASR